MHIQTTCIAQVSRIADSRENTEQYVWAVFRIADSLVSCQLSQLSQLSQISLLRQLSHLSAKSASALSAVRTVNSVSLVRC